MFLLAKRPKVCDSTWAAQLAANPASLAITHANHDAKARRQEDRVSRRHRCRRKMPRRRPAETSLWERVGFSGLLSLPICRRTGLGA